MAEPGDSVFDGVGSNPEKVKKGKYENTTIELGNKRALVMLVTAVLPLE